MTAPSAAQAWLDTLMAVRVGGREVSPRGLKTRELPQHTLTMDMRRPVVTVPERKLNYQFMAAEALFILMGSDKVADVAPWNKRIAEFSDDGVTFFGAYGPKVLGQLDHVVRSLVADPSSRQAGLTIWRENPPKTKDTPCTVAMFFSIRERPEDPSGLGLEASVYMRSNDVWLGTPYDVFNFSMVAHLVCCRLNQHAGQADGRPVEPTTLRLTAASSHLYETNAAGAEEVLSARVAAPMLDGQRETPEDLFNDSQELRRRLMKLRDTRPGDPLRWWEAR